MSEKKSACPFSWPDGFSSALTFSFDDARISQVETGFPLFEKLGTRATFYVMPQRVANRRADWQAALAAGHEVGNHTTTHPCSAHFEFARNKPKTLDDMTLEDIEQEILDANKSIEDSLGITPSTFAHPCGQKYVGRGINTRSYIPIVAKHFIVGRGFKDESHNCPVYGDPIKSMGVDSDDRTPEDLLGMLSRSNDAGGWLFFAGHEIGDGGFQTTRTDAITALVQYAKENNIWVDTAENIGRYILSQQGS